MEGMACRGREETGQENMWQAKEDKQWEIKKREISKDIKQTNMIT